MIERYREITFTSNFQNLSSPCIFDESLVIKKSSVILCKASVMDIYLFIRREQMTLRYCVQSLNWQIIAGCRNARSNSLLNFVVADKGVKS